MRGFRVWIKEKGFIIEGMEWGNEVVLARRFDFEPFVCWKFKNMGEARNYFWAAFGPDVHVVFATAGELRFEVPGLLPVRPSEPGSAHVPEPNVIQPETPELAIEPKPKRTRSSLKAIK